MLFTYLLLQFPWVWCLPFLEHGVYTDTLITIIHTPTRTYLGQGKHINNMQWKKNSEYKKFSYVKRIEHQHMQQDKEGHRIKVHVTNCSYAWFCSRTISTFTALTEITIWYIGSTQQPALVISQTVLLPSVVNHSVLPRLQSGMAYRKWSVLRHTWRFSEVAEDGTIYTTVHWWFKQLTVLTLRD